MQVPADLAARLTDIAISSGSTPEKILRDALSRAMENTPPTFLQKPIGPDMALLEGSPQLPSRFVPQSFRVSIYE